jgi:probable F420-dependent oxidoreductase
MRVGLILPNILSAANDAETLRRCALLAEDSGYDSIWATDHVLMPRQHERYGNGGEIVVTLTYMAAITRRVELGTGILILPLRNPLVVAKQFATLDDLSGGRTIFGIGVGWNKDEYGYLNADFHRRGRLADEYLDIIYKLWTQDTPTHNGAYTFSDVTFAPRPRRIPPLYIGGESDAAIKRAATRGDAWLPNGPIPDLAQKVARLRELAGDRQVTVAMAMRLDMRDGAQAALDAIMEQADAGLQYPTIRFWHETRADLTAQIERFARDVLPDLKAAGKLPQAD